MKIFVLLILLLININAIKGGYNSNCEIEGVSRYDWSYRYTRSEYVDDVHDGLIVTYKTAHILEMTKQFSPYLTAVFENEMLSIYTNEKFKTFEDEYPGTNEISLKMTFNCADNTSEELHMIQKVRDTNNHDPVLNQELYEYSFGMPLPEDYDLTKFLTISANDTDFSNNYIYFTIGYNQDLVVTYKGRSDYDGDNYYTSFKTLKEIRGPFKEEYTLTAIDGGEPARNTTARLILTVTSNDSNGEDGNNESNENGNGSGENLSHPPVFAQHLYLANYTSYHELRLENAITIKYGAEESTTIKQSGYQEYFEVILKEPKKAGQVHVRTLKPLPRYILDTTQLLIIEIEAENEGFRHMPGRTALIVRLPSGQQSSSNDTSQNCNISHSIHFQNSNNVVLVIFFVSIVFIIVIANVIVLTWYYQRRNSIQASFNNVPTMVEEVKQDKSFRI
ncbi:hypothetical protein ILUMI_04121 [Ignelater luminosus]|uniref:Cadherin domain-containing protein n=1 Tax=Ignelater luminosus TaxID=2038154 RepID=A0A8K0GHN3_IGNLU|nr:hypothetical protein ILUMI_04121 [Ignelater luminosus]